MPCLLKLLNIFRLTLARASLAASALKQAIIKMDIRFNLTSAATKFPIV